MAGADTPGRLSVGAFRRRALYAHDPGSDFACRYTLRLRESPPITRPDDAWRAADPTVTAIWCRSPRCYTADVVASRRPGVANVSYISGATEPANSLPPCASLPLPPTGETHPVLLASRVAAPVIALVDRRLRPVTTIAGTDLGGPCDERSRVPSRRPRAGRADRDQWLRRRIIPNRAITKMMREGPEQKT